MKNILFPILVAFLITPFCFIQAAEGVKLELSVEKSSFMLGEPVVVLVKVTNTGDSELAIVGGVEPEFDVLHYEVAGPDGESKPFSPLYVADTDKRIVLNRGESMHGTARIFYGGNGYTFSKAGTYKVTASFKNYRSNTLSIQISEPQNQAEREQARLILENSEVGLFLMLEGGDELKEAHRVRDTFQQEYPQSLLTAYLKFAQGKNLSVPARNFVSKQPRDANLEGAIEMLQSVKDREMQMYYRVKTATTLSTCYQKTGQMQEAQKVLEEMQQTLNRQERLTPYFSPEISSELQRIK